MLDTAWDGTVVDSTSMSMFLRKMHRENQVGLDWIRKGKKSWGKERGRVENKASNYQSTNNPFNQFVD